MEQIENNKFNLNISSIVNVCPGKIKQQVYLHNAHLIKSSVIIVGSILWNE